MFYIAHRLFAAHDRHLGSLAAARIAAAAGDRSVFLPFCDTNEEDLQAELKGQRLFDLDCERLPQLHAMLAVLHGPSLDDGVCMEIGYAAALGIPIVVLTTDFITYGTTPDAPAMAFPDPIIETVATEIVSTGRLAPANSSSGSRFDVFGQRNQDQLHAAIDLAVVKLLEHARPPEKRPGRAYHGDAVFAEPSPYAINAEWDKLLGAIPARVRQASRFTQSDPHEGARADWEALTECRALLADVAGPETPPGAALMIGASVAAGRQVLVANGSTSWTFASGREPNWRNLMIQYSASAQVNDPAHLAAVLSS